MELRPEKKKPVLGTGGGRVLGAEETAYINDPEVVCVLGRVARVLVKMREGFRSEVWQGQDHMGLIGQLQRRIWILLRVWWEASRAF